MMGQLTPICPGPTTAHRLSLIILKMHLLLPSKDFPFTLTMTFQMVGGKTNLNKELLQITNVLPFPVPTDLSMNAAKTQTTYPPHDQASTGNGIMQATPAVKLPILTHKLNPAEINAVRQLLTGYRESAAFLLRSAEELEQLLQQQQNQ